MRINSEILGSVGFIGLPSKSEGREERIRWGGTCFFIEEPASESRAKIWGYLVTARHVAEKVADREFFVRLNLLGGGSEVIVGPSETRWWVHPKDAAVDVALLRWLPPEDTFTIKRWNVSDFVTNKDILDGTFGPGDDIDMFGLFRPVPGYDQNLPILRNGTLSMVPAEPVNTGRGSTDVYLVEARSIGGLSGSPVVVTQTMRHAIGEAGVKGVGKSALLGLVHGHWDLQEDDETSNISSVGSAESGHSGVSIVVPAQKILDVINQEELVELKMAELPELLEPKS